MNEVCANPIYKGIGLRTVQRDIKFLRENGLLKVEDGELLLNLDGIN